MIAIYSEDVVPKHARPKETAARLENVLDFMGSETLSYLNKDDLRRLCETSRRQVYRPPRA